jgi:hypothetical protein
MLRSALLLASFAGLVVGQDAVCGGADLDANTAVDVGDLLLLLAAFGTSADGDIDGNGSTDVSDLLALLGNFGAAGCTTEPGAQTFVTIIT